MNSTRDQGCRHRVYRSERDYGRARFGSLQPFPTAAACFFTPVAINTSNKLGWPLRQT